jgi:hypothetical protein
MSQVRSARASCCSVSERNSVTRISTGLSARIRRQPPSRSVRSYETALLSVRKGLKGGEGVREAITDRYDRVRLCRTELDIRVTRRAVKSHCWRL